MPYIGKQPTVGNFQVCDAISVVNGQAAYTMQVNSTNVEPETAFHMLVSLNGILQKPGSSFTISGSTITFASNLATGDVIDFIILLGNVLDIGTPSDDSVGAAQIKNDLISGTTALATAPADTDEFLVSDAGTLKRIDYSLIKGGISEVDQWRLTASLTSNTDPISSNLERVDDGSFEKIGTGMSVSSGVWTFASTGLYKVSFFFIMDCTAADNGVLNAYATTDNGGAWDLVVGATAGANASGGAGNSGTGYGEFLINVDNTSNVKLKFTSTSLSNAGLRGSSTDSSTAFTFLRLGDSQ
jgi:hypothetical protein